MSLFDKQKSERKKKLAESTCLEKVEWQQIDDIDQDTDLEKTTRQSQKLNNFVQNYFFCDKPSTDNKLRQSLEINPNAGGGNFTPTVGFF